MLPQPTDNFGTKHAVAQSESRDATPFIPDVNGLVPYKAALEYANGGLYLLPVDPRDPKNPGSRVGKNWPEKSTIDADLIGAYWDCDTPPSIAVHTGRSGLVAFDYDVDGPLPDELAWLKAARCQLSRPGETANERGMYVFAATETFIAGKFLLGDGTQVGEIRSGNSVFIVQPSVHAKSAIGAAYQWTGHGSVPELPDIARNYLSKLSTRAVGGKGQIVADREAITAFKSATAQANSRPRALNNLTASLSKKTEGTRDCLRNYLRIAADESRADFYPFDRATAELETAARASYALRAQRGEIGANFETHIGAHDFARLVANAVGHALSRSEAEIVAEANRKYGTDHRDNAGIVAGLQLNTLGNSVIDRPRYQGVSAAELAEPIPPMHWLVRGVWPQRSAGVFAGDKKTLKTWNLQAMAVAVAAGLPMLDRFEVSTPGPVLYLCGEGGQHAFANRHQVIAARYGIDAADLADVPLTAEFDVDAVDTEVFRNGVANLLDRLQPVLVVLDPLYAYHPSGVSGSNLYERGPMLAKLRELVEGHAALVVADHFKKSAGDGLDLDHISMAGMSQWADSWALQVHRQLPDLSDAAASQFKLEAQYATRRGGAENWEIDWTLKRDESDPDVIAWAAVDWSVQSANTVKSLANASTKGMSKEVRQSTILGHIGAHGDESKSMIIRALTTAHGGRAAFMAEFEALERDGVIEESEKHITVQRDGKPYQKRVKGWKVSKAVIVKLNGPDDSADDSADDSEPNSAASVGDGAEQ